MALIDLPLEQLTAYLPERTEPADFDAFWAETLGDARERQWPARFSPAHPELRALEVFDVTYAGYAGQPIRAWLILPRTRTGPVPAVVEYVGYGGGRGLPMDWLRWPAAGYATFVMDTRGQGSGWVSGDTPDVDPDGGGPQVAGFLTRGILDPRTYYYRRVFTDAVMAVAAAREHEAIDPDRVVVAGTSQGGGITLAVSALEPTVVAALVDVPFLCHFRRAIEITDEQPYRELRQFLGIHRGREDDVFRTLGYMDGLNFASRARVPALFAVGLMDEVCPPSTVFAAYNHYAGPKEIRVWPWNGHEAGDAQHAIEELRYLEALGIPGPV
jgi:cephalosporin-C deacetylase